MASSLNRFGRPAYPKTIHGETYWVRTMTIGELAKLDQLQAGEKNAFVIGCISCTDHTGALEFPKQDGETETAWIERIRREIDDIPPELIRALSEASDFRTIPTLEAVVKNFDQT